MAEEAKKIEPFVDTLPADLVDVPLWFLERAAIVQSWRKHKSSKKVAHALGVSIRKIQYKLAKYRKAGWL